MPLGEVGIEPGVDGEGAVGRAPIGRRQGERGRQRLLVPRSKRSIDRVLQPIRLELAVLRDQDEIDQILDARALPLRAVDARIGMELFGNVLFERDGRYDDGRNAGEGKEVWACQEIWCPDNLLIDADVDSYVFEPPTSEFRNDPEVNRRGINGVRQIVCADDVQREVIVQIKQSCDL
jgi:hypothetical protein